MYFRRIPVAFNFYSLGIVILRRLKNSNFFKIWNSFLGFLLP